jgi:hypothetical protein
MSGFWYKMTRFHLFEPSARCGLKTITNRITDRPFTALHGMTDLDPARQVKRPILPFADLVIHRIGDQVDHLGP